MTSVMSWIPATDLTRWTRGGGADTTGCGGTSGALAQVEQLQKQARRAPPPASVLPTPRAARRRDRVPCLRASATQHRRHRSGPSARVGAP